MVPIITKDISKDAMKGIRRRPVKKAKKPKVWERDRVRYNLAG